MSRPSGTDASTTAARVAAGAVLEDAVDVAAADTAEDADDSDDTDETEDDGDDGRTLRRVGWFVACLAVMLLVQTFVAEAVRVRFDSMAPTIAAGDVVVIDRLTYRFRDPRIGEMVVTEDPRSGVTIVKRVVAVGGDSVGIEDGRLVRNGAPVPDPHADSSMMDGYFHGPVVVPEGEVFLLGDNRDTSIDSRAFGTVDVDEVQGRVIGHVWPLGGR